MTKRTCITCRWVGDSVLGKDNHHCNNPRHGVSKITGELDWHYCWYTRDLLIFKCMPWGWWWEEQATVAEFPYKLELRSQERSQARHELINPRIAQMQQLTAKQP